MNQGADIRWKQRFSNFQRALAKLSEHCALGHKLSELEEQGLIQCFEYTYELGWNTLRDFYIQQGEDGLQGSRDAIQLAFKRGLIDDGDVWLAMLKDRNRSSHTYNKETADEIVRNIRSSYLGAFEALHNKLLKVE
jgi:nucleotidyltransferase substrate binding protein (TIGR01987 family)